MKIFFLNLVFTFLFTSFCVSQNMYAQYTCAPNENLTTQDLGPDASGCYWRITFCFSCDITGINPSNVTILYWVPIPGQTGCTVANKDEIIELVRQYLSIFCTVRDCDPEDPQWYDHCLGMTIKYPLCWQWHILGSVNNGIWSFKKWMEVCPGEGYCQIYFTQCRNPITSIVDKCPGGYVAYTEVGVTCSTTLISVPPDPPQTPDNLGDHTYGGCFKAYSCP